MNKPKIGYTITFHHSDEIRPNGKKVVKQNLDSFYANCKHEFRSFIVDNQSVPSTSFGDVFDISLDKYKNLQYTYIENQFEKGITGAWSLGINQAIEAGSDIIILTTDDTIINETINNLIDYVISDPNSGNTIYGPMASGVTVPLQRSDGPINKVFEIPGTFCPKHLGGHMYVFTKEFYHKWKSENGDLFVIDQPHNGGDGKWGGNEGNVIHWAEQGAKCVVVGPCWIEHVQDTRYSYRTARDIDRRK
jgi:hypothetical protein